MCQHQREPAQTPLVTEPGHRRGQEGCRQIEGANGFQNLREDLNERARVRSGGRVREVVIQSLVVE